MAEGKVYHRASKIASNGDVSALCYAKPRRINLARESWTLIDSAVTCPKCRALIDAAKAGGA